MMLHELMLKDIHTDEGVQYMNIHKYVFISVLGPLPSFIPLLQCHISKVVQNRQTKHWLHFMTPGF